MFKGSAGCPRAAGWMPGLARETVPSTPSAGGWTGTRAPRRLGTLWETSCPETGCPFPARLATWAPPPPPEGLVEPTSRMEGATGGQGGPPSRELPAQLAAGLQGWWVDGGPPRPPAVTVPPSRGTGL